MTDLVNVLSGAPAEADIRRHGAKSGTSTAEVVRMINPETPRRGRGRPRKPPEVIEDILARRARGNSLKEIGLSYGVTVQAISKLLQAHVPELTHAKDEAHRSDLAKVIDLWRKRLQRRQIARELQMPLGRVIYLLRRHRPMCDVIDGAKARLRRVKVLTVPARRRRRRWSADEKARIIADTLAPSASVAEVALRWQICPQQVFNWRRQARVRGSPSIR
jgi:transposase-like protein